ncbi:hypothetical protein Nepgr_021117 [Nepenthes gracilis]|uniref:Uncharacterized protein n=1 Tax=Nepenthes gracilis TaxID=150966 RepID=A0AAD3XX17_NEPGR|nr:hypothetical protein Nepgr_021117 [Nepenthes gracilis]
MFSDDLATGRCPLGQPDAANGAWCMWYEIYAYVRVDISVFSSGASVVAILPVVTTSAMDGVFACAIWDNLSEATAITLLVWMRFWDVLP